LHASSHRVHRREERKRALLKEEEEEEEVDLLFEKAFTHHTHLKTEKNESIKRDERERIGHHADRTASVQVCVCFITSVFFFSRSPFKREEEEERAHPHGEKNGSSFGKKKDFPPRGVPVRERNLSLFYVYFFSPLRVA